MEFKYLYPLVKPSVLRSNYLGTFVRGLFTQKYACYHNKSWEIEDSEDEGNFNKPSYKGKGSWSHPRNRYESYYNNSRYDNYSRRSQRDNYFDRNNFNRRERNHFDVGENISKPNWQEINLEPFEKNFYIPSEAILNRPKSIVENFRNIHNLTLQEENVPDPIIEFSDYNFPEEISSIFSRKKFEAPTPIQAQGWPIALSGRDLIGIGQTGSGKTLGYIIPGLIHIKNQPKLKLNDGPIGLVMAPTRELVQQIHEVTHEVSMATNVRTCCLFGGASKNSQANMLSKGPSLCIATPGRLLDFLEMGVLNLRRCTYLVLDEADRMLDMGFEPQIRKVVDQIRPDRQTLMWSATWPKEVQELAMDFLSNSIRLNVGSLDLVANPDIEQMVEVCGSFEKYERFIEKLNSEMEEIKSKILVFAQTKSQVDYLSRKLYHDGIRASGIHGGHSQASRDRTLHGFRTGRFSVLVATDVASRGLDVDDISLVFNYDFPNCIEDYIHRIGRTGRAGKAGKAFSLVTENSGNLAKELIRVLKEAKQNVPAELYELQEQDLDARKMKRKYKGFNRYRSRNDSFGQR